MGSFPQKLRACVAIGSVVLAVSGCQSNGSRRVAPVEPGLSGRVDASAPVVETTPLPATSVSWTDRHPLFTKPREYYEKSTSNSKFARTAAATVIGIPAGFVGELRQIVTGTATPPRS